MHPISNYRFLVVFDREYEAYNAEKRTSNDSYHVYTVKVRRWWTDVISKQYCGTKKAFFDDEEVFTVNDHFFDYCILSIITLLPYYIVVFFYYEL